MKESTSTITGNPFFKKMNDLAFHGTLENYDTDQNVLEHINVGHVNTADMISMFFGGGKTLDLYCYALKDIKAGEELSRYYSPGFWYDVLFWKQFPDCNFLQTGLDEDLPSKYTYCGRITRGLEYNHSDESFCL